MKKLLKHELMKIFRTRLFYFILLAFACMIIIKVFDVYSIPVTTPTPTPANPNPIPNYRSGVKFMYTFNFSFVIMVYTVFVALYTNFDFANRTILQFYSKGYKRNQIFLAKLIVLLVYVTMFFFINLLVTLVVGTIFFGNEHIPALNYPLLLFGQYIFVLCYCLMCFSVCMVIRKQVPTIVFGSLSNYVFALLEAGIMNMTSKEFQKNPKLGTYMFNGRECPFLIYELFISQYPDRLTSIIVNPDWLVWFYIMMLVVYASVFVIISLFINNKSEVIN